MYRDQDQYGELFDLHTDPEERINRWEDAEYAVIKAALLQCWINEEIAREPTRFPRIAGA
jgi:hypothetical protein